jgi:CRP-like cAMP-binding protein
MFCLKLTPTQTMIGPTFRNRLLELLPRIPLFGAIPESDVEEFILPLGTAKFPCRESLFREGDPPGALHLILEGEATLTHRGRTVATVGEGDLLGADAMIGIHAHPLTAVTRTACVVLVIPASAIYRLSKLKPRVFAILMTNIARDFARRIRDMSQLVAPATVFSPNDPPNGKPREVAYHHAAQGCAPPDPQPPHTPNPLRRPWRPRSCPS